MSEINGSITADDPEIQNIINDAMGEDRGSICDNNNNNNKSEVKMCDVKSKKGQGKGVPHRTWAGKIINYIEVEMSKHPEINKDATHNFINFLKPIDEEVLSHRGSNNTYRLMVGRMKKFKSKDEFKQHIELLMKAFEDSRIPA